MITTVNHRASGVLKPYVLTLEELGTFMTWLAALHRPNDPVTITVEQSPLAPLDYLEPPHYRYGGE